MLLETQAETPLMRAGQRVQLTARARFRTDEHLGPLHVAPYIAPMCGRVVQASEPLRYAFVDGLSLPDSRTKPPSYNVAPSQTYHSVSLGYSALPGPVLAMAQAQLPHGAADIPPPGDEVHSF